MPSILKKTSIIIFVFLVLILSPSCRKSKGPYNPYLKMKTKPSDAMRQENKRILKKNNKSYDKQLGKNRKKLFGRKKPPKA